LTTEQFIERIEAYYNTRYPAGQKPYIVKYLGMLSERALDFMFSVCLKNYSAKWGKVPDIAVFEEFRSEVRDELENDTGNQNLNRLGISDDAGDEVDMSEFINNISQWMKDRSK